VRVVGAALLLFGLVVAILGTMSGCNAFFAWNGRHPVLAQPLTEGRSTAELTTTGGKRYTLAVQVVFDREGLETKEGNLVALAKIPLVVKAKDPADTTRAEVAGWLDPNEPPNVLYNQAARESVRGPSPELLVERLVGPFTAASSGPLTVSVDLGADRIQAARILERRLVVYDDSLPASIRNSFLVAGVGALAFVIGLVSFVVGWFRRRRGRAVVVNPGRSAS
jgi:hypothetical protein